MKTLLIIIVSSLALSSGTCETFNLTFANFTEDKLFVGVADSDGNIIDHFILNPGDEKRLEDLEFKPHYLLLADEFGNREIAKFVPTDKEARIIFCDKDASRL